MFVNLNEVEHFNPRSSCEERRILPVSPDVPHLFQSTLLMRGATRRSMGYIEGILFQSTLLMRGATAGTAKTDSVLTFQSTLLIRGATRHLVAFPERRLISIHAPHARSD